MTQDIQNISPLASEQIRPVKTGKVATEAKANVDKIVALNANLLAAA